jgi:arylformamidase
MRPRFASLQPTRRQVLAGAGALTAAVVASPALAQKYGPAPHPKGPAVFLDYDQIELDAAYDQMVYEPNLPQVGQRFASNSAAVRARSGDPRRVA